ncbi:MAG: LuxR C-terminal-related transcriptional regulator [Devosia sp.]
MLREALRGGTAQEIGARVGLEKRTIDVHHRNIFRKLGCDRHVLARCAADLEQIPAVAVYLGAIATRPPANRQRGPRITIV